MVLADGETIRADLVVSNADVTHTYGKLVPEGTTKRWRPSKLKRASQSMSLFVWYFGTKGRRSDVPHHTILLGPRYQGLLDDIFRRKVWRRISAFTCTGRPRPIPASPRPAMMPSTCSRRAEPEGRAGLGPPRRDLSPADRGRARPHDPPRFQDDIVTSRVMHPGHFRDELLAPFGAAFSLEPVLLQSAWFRPHNRSEDPRPLSRRRWDPPGAGLPGVLSSARILDQVVPHGSTVAT